MMDLDGIAGDFNMWSQLEDIRQKNTIPDLKAEFAKIIEMI